MTVWQEKKIFPRVITGNFTGFNSELTFLEKGIITTKLLSQHYWLQEKQIYVHFELGETKIINMIKSLI